MRYKNKYFTIQKYGSPFDPSFRNFGLRGNQFPTAFYLTSNGDKSLTLEELKSKNVYLKNRKNIKTNFLNFKTTCALVHLSII